MRMCRHQGKLSKNYSYSLTVLVLDLLKFRMQPSAGRTFEVPKLLQGYGRSCDTYGVWWLSSRFHDRRSRFAGRHWSDWAVRDRCRTASRILLQVPCGAECNRQRHKNNHNGKNTF